jgi:hypothetical protein
MLKAFQQTSFSVLERDNTSIAIPISLPAFFYASTYYRKGGHEGRPSVFQ